MGRCLRVHLLRNQDYRRVRAGLDENGPDDTYTKTFILIASTDIGSRSSLEAVGGLNPDGSGFVSPQSSYTVADGLQAEVKVCVFLGGTSAAFGRLNGNNYGEVSVSYAF